ncbi:hypothetical protein BDF21DRAFT_334845, partial [Thamnidium elegans]
TLKLLAYADYVCLLLQDESDFLRVKYKIQRYTLVSNVKFNVDKAEAFSPHGKLH